MDTNQREAENNRSNRRLTQIDDPQIATGLLLWIRLPARRYEYRSCTGLLVSPRVVFKWKKSAYICVNLRLSRLDFGYRVGVLRFSGSI